MVPTRSARPRTVLAACAALAMASITTGCGDILSLEQSSSNQIDARGLYIPANAQLLVNGVIADFECAYTRVVAGMAILGDEIINAWANGVLYDYERRTVSPSHGYAGDCSGSHQVPSFYTGLNTARGMADTAYIELSRWTDAQVPDRARLQAEAALYGGYSLIMLGEAMCSGAINVGPELTSMELFREAKQRLDNAVTHAQESGDPQVLSFARLARARALRNLGELSAAAEDAALIPPDFVQNVSPDATYPRRQNVIYMHVTQSFFGSVGPYYRDLTMEDGRPDPRVQVTNTGFTGNVGAMPIWTPDKYPSVTTPIPVTRYAEAQLIIAEARIAAGDLAGAAVAINNARNSGGRVDMPQYDATGKTQQEVLADLLEERRREFFLEGRRFWDVRAFNLPLDPAPGTPYVAGGEYADVRCFPLPNVERNRNPNIN